MRPAYRGAYLAPSTRAIGVPDSLPRDAVYCCISWERVACASGPMAVTDCILDAPRRSPMPPTQQRDASVAAQVPIQPPVNGCSTSLP